MLFEPLEPIFSRVRSIGHRADQAVYCGLWQAQSPRQISGRYDLISALCEVQKHLHHVAGDFVVPCCKLG